MVAVRAVVRVENVIVVKVIYLSFCSVVQMVVVVVLVQMWCWQWFGISGDGGIVMVVMVTAAVRVEVVFSSY